MPYSQVPRAVEAWRNEFTSKNRKRIAEGIASPSKQAKLFSEGWEEALEREKGQSLDTSDKINGIEGKVDVCRTSRLSENACSSDIGCHSC